MSEYTDGHGISIAALHVPGLSGSQTRLLLQCECGWMASFAQVAMLDFIAEQARQHRAEAGR